MKALRAIKEQIAKLGYSAIENEYMFSDVFSASATNRIAAIAAFTSKPASYRNAAIAAVEAKGRNAHELTTEYRALGAPLLFVVSGDDVAAWQVTSTGIPREVARSSLEHLDALFSQNAHLWNPESVHRGKTIGQFSRPAQLDFIDVGLLPAIEGEVQVKLDILLNETLAEAIRITGGRSRYRLDQRLLFRTVFRLLAAKILQDREHELATTWDQTDISSVLSAISKYYTLSPLQGEQSALQSAVFASAWDRLRRGINFRNISSDALAFVYENTLITRETRREFGTHGTPRSVAEYVVSRLQFADSDLQGVRVYEPFAGAGIFMVAALTALRDRLPMEWTDKQRHQFLVERLSGDERDPFAKEVATLSLILADYPNANGWSVSEIDLFENGVLQSRMKTANVILCNPPFEDFKQNERARYLQASARSVAKPVVALETAIDASPRALGFVLPEPFVKGPQYRAQRERIEKKYKDIEIVTLPDRTFAHSVIRSSLLIARSPRDAGSVAATSLRSTEISVKDRDQFLKRGRVTTTRTTLRSPPRFDGNLWINELQDLWEYLSSYPKMGEIASAARGIEWQGQQSKAISQVPKVGFVPGVREANSVHAFAIPHPMFLDVRPQNLRGGAIALPWQEDKILANAARISRGPWCLAAAVDRAGLVGSQQLYGVWPKSNVSLDKLSAILNGPLANAYSATHSPPDRIRKTTLLSIPIPRDIPDKVADLARQYGRTVSGGTDLFSERRTERSDALLNQIDALVLKAYDLPPRLEKELLEYFRGARRPTLHDWTHWLPKDFAPFIPLYRLLSDEYKLATSGWVLDVFKPLPTAEADAVREYLE